MRAFLLCVHTKVAQFDDFGADNASAHLAMLSSASWREEQALAVPQHFTRFPSKLPLLLPLPPYAKRQNMPNRDNEMTLDQTDVRQEWLSK